MSIDWKCTYWIKIVPIDQKDTYWMKMCILTEKVYIEWECAYWKMKSHNCSVFLNEYVALIYVTMWYNKEQLI